MRQPGLTCTLSALGGQPRGGAVRDAGEWCGQTTQKGGNHRAQGATKSDTHTYIHTYISFCVYISLHIYPYNLCVYRSIYAYIH